MECISTIPLHGNGNHAMECLKCNLCVPLISFGYPRTEVLVITGLTAFKYIISVIESVKKPLGFHKVLTKIIYVLITFLSRVILRNITLSSSLRYSHWVLLTESSFFFQVKFTNVVFLELSLR